MRSTKRMRRRGTRRDEGLSGVVGTGCPCFLPSDRRLTTKSQRTGAVAALPRLRLRLRTVLVFVSLVILLLPAIGVYALREHENTLVQQRESDLARAANVVAATYRTMFGRFLDDSQNGLALHSAALESSSKLAWPSLDLGVATIGDPFPSATRAAAEADAVALRAGEEMAAVLREASISVTAGARLLDWRGTVVATTEGDLGASLQRANEVRQALDGTGIASLRRTALDSETFLNAIVRGVGLTMIVAVPVVLDERLVGVVVMSRPSPNIIDSLMEKRFLLVQGAALFFAVALAISVVTLRTLVLPIKRLSVAAQRVSDGETDRFERGRPYRVREVAGLADSIEVMVENLQRRTRYIRDLAYSISHEFKTPIAAVLGAAELMGDQGDELSPAEVRHFANNIAADVARLDRLTKQLLALAQAEMAMVGDETTDVLAAARSVGCAAMQVANGPDMRARIAPESLKATLDILANNALGYGATQVDVRAASTGDKVELWVSDDGPGIASGDRARVFDPFFTTRRDSGGTGLGLTICRAFVDGSGGSIELLPSERGATFKLTLRHAGAAGASG